MKREVSRLVGFLQADDPELRRAAARVLGALGPSDPAVVEALGACLGQDDLLLREAALGALEAIGPAPALDRIAGLLNEPGDVGRHAMEVVSGVGGRVLARLKKHLPAMGEVGRRRILTLAARMRGADGMDLIVKALETGRGEEVRAVSGRLSLELLGARQRERDSLVRRLEAFLGRAGGGAPPEAVGAAIDLLARVVGGAAQERLLGYADRSYAPEVRRRALEALAHIAPEADLSPELLSKVLRLLKDKDYANVVAPAMSVLEKAKLAQSHATPLLACLRGNDPALRRFAVTALGQLDTARSAAALLKVLKGDNPDLQKRAAVSLAKLPSAVPQVVTGLVQASDAGTAWILARILMPHAHSLKKSQVSTLAAATAAWLEPGDPRAEAALTILRDRYRAALAEHCIQRVKRLKRNRRAGEMLNLLRPLFVDGEAPNSAVAYEAALAEIMRGRKEVLREIRLANPGLRTLETLLHDPAFPLLTRLKRDKHVLEPEEFYLIGSHFAERTYEDKAFGGDLLRWMIQTFPEDSHAEAAVYKLHMEGFPPPPKPRARKKKAAKKSAPAMKKAAPAKKKPAKKSAPAKKKPAPSKKKAAPAKKKPVKKAAKKAAGAGRKRPARKK